MFFVNVPKEIPNFDNVLDVIQYRTELDMETCQKVRDDLYAFYSRLGPAEVDALLLEYYRDTQAGVTAAMLDIAHHKYEATDSFMISIQRIEALKRGEKGTRDI